MGAGMMAAGGLLVVAAVIITPGATVTTKSFVADLLLIAGIVLFRWGWKVRAK